MALNVKVSLLICLAFTAALSWVVNGMAPPVVERPSPLHANGRILAADLWGARAQQTGRRARPPHVEGRFERPNVIEVAALRQPTRVTQIDLPPAQPAMRHDELPPLYAAHIERSWLEDPTRQPAFEEPPVIGTPLMATVATHAEPAVEPSPAEPASQAYRVRKGDTLVQIARRFLGGDDAQAVARLVEANPQIAARRDHILIGEQLVIPAGDGDAGDQADGLVGSQRMLAAVSPGQPHAAFEWYIVRKDDSLIRIARRKLNDAARWREIAQLNRIANADRIVPGMRIRLPTS